ncbi:MAG: enolase C-terminal domain-like protein [Polyangiaceae bacterium]
MRVHDVQLFPLALELTESFGIAGGALTRADNVLVQLTLEDGSRGLGEAAPFPAFNGETQRGVLECADEVRSMLVGGDARRLRHLSSRLCEHTLPACLRAATEMALLDAVTRARAVSLCHWFGGAETTLQTDITVVTGDAAHARVSAERATAQGFDRIKVKVGGVPQRLDADRVCAIAAAAPAATLLLDANASLSADQALALLAALGEVRERVSAFEQPCAAHDLAGLATVRRSGVRVVADESVTCPADLLPLRDCVDVVNVKLMKSGVIGALDLALSARALGFGLMIGGLVESDLAMSVAACLAAGLGGFEIVDLDTPLFLRDAPFRGGVSRQGPHLDLTPIAAGHGVEAISARP